MGTHRLERTSREEIKGNEKKERWWEALTDWQMQQRGESEDKEGERASKSHQLG
jgi:hypothetical protein